MNKWSDVVKKRVWFGVAALGITAIVTVGALSINNKEETPNHLVDLNEGADVQMGQKPQTPSGPTAGPTAPVALGGEQGATEGELPWKGTADGVSSQEEMASGEPGSEVGSPEPVSGGELTASTDEPEESSGDEGVSLAAGASQTETGSAEEPEETQAVSNPQVIAADLTYRKEDGLLWPLSGSVLIPYSPDHGVFHFTLEQFRTSDAVVLASEVGTPVAAAARGVVTSISEEPRTGTTVRIALGNDTYLVYGQMELDGLAEGDLVEEGEIIGRVAKPTKYYVIEGPNLYFQVLEDEGTINPMLLLHEKLGESKEAESEKSGEAEPSPEEKR